MSPILFLLCAIVLVSAVSDRPARYDLEDAELHFQNFIEEHSKNYASEYEKQFRFEIFKRNLERINQLNEKSEHAEYGITQFTDLTSEDFQRQYTGLLRDVDADFETKCTVITDDDITYNDAPESFDWRPHNAVTRVKDQQCGDSYAFSSTGTIEGQYAIKHKQLVDLSEQQILDCDDRNNGCMSGLMTYALMSVIDRGGIESEDDYHYAGDNSSCKFDASKVKVKLSGCLNYNLTSQEKLKQALYHNGPISIAIKSTALGLYVTGIIDDWDCDEGDIDYGALLVGYGISNREVPYWLVKTSYGRSFGEYGYFRVQRGENCHSCAMLNDMMASAVVE